MMKKPALLAMFLAFAVPSTLIFAAEGGGGHNGPNLFGDSIDLTLDRAITRDQMNHVLGRCLVDTVAETYRAMTKNPSAMLVLLSSYSTSVTGSDQVGGTLNADAYLADPERPGYAGYKIRTVLNAYGARLCSGQRRKVDSTQEGKCSEKKKVNFSSVTLEIKLTSSLSFKADGFPYIAFEVDESAAYDHLGQRVPGLAPVTRVSLFSGTQDELPLKNSETGRVLDYSVNGQKYVDCVKASL